MAFYVLKEYDYTGFIYKTFSNENDAIKAFEQFNSRPLRLVSEKATLYKYEEVLTTTLPPIFLPTERYMYNYSTNRFEFVKFKKSYKKLIKEEYLCYCELGKY